LDDIPTFLRTIHECAAALPLHTKLAADDHLFTPSPAVPATVELHEYATVHLPDAIMEETIANIKA